VLRLSEAIQAIISGGPFPGLMPRIREVTAMHEATLVRQIYRIAEQSLEGRKVKRVAAVKISVGEMSGALPDALEFAFHAQRSGIFEDAELLIEKEPVAVRCKVCGEEYSPQGFPIRCPLCGDTACAFIRGDDVHVSGIQYEKED